MTLQIKVHHSLLTEVPTFVFVFEGHCFSCKNERSVNLRHPADEALYVGGREDCQFPFMWESMSEVLQINLASFCAVFCLQYFSLICIMSY
jgi:hypothetical protein